MSRFLVTHIIEYDGEIQASDCAVAVVDAANKPDAIFEANKLWGATVDPGDEYVVTPLVTIDDLGVIHVPA